MTRFRLSIHIVPRRGILDPQGKAVSDALHSLGFGDVGDVRVGRYLVVEMQAEHAEAARDSARAMCERLLANPVTEDFEIAAVSQGMKAAIVRFPGSNCDEDAFHAVSGVLGHEAVYCWHKEHDLQGADIVVLPGGFSYGDYLRAGAIARFSPIMREVIAFAERGGPVLGICNGFQIACEAGLLPGALLRNASLRFVSAPVHLRVESIATRFTSHYHVDQVIRVPIAHGDGRYTADADTLACIEGEGQVVFRYVNANGDVTDAANPNGSMRNIAGVVNARGNVIGMMPHPERAMESLMESSDGLPLFTSVFESLLAKVGA